MIQQLASLISNSSQRWPDGWSMTDREWQESAQAHGVYILLANRVVCGEVDHCPKELASQLKQARDHSIAQELLRRHYLQQMLAQCAQFGIEVILIKGTPLAYKLFSQPYCRTRCDTDLLIQEADKQRLIDCLSEIDYRLTETISGELVSRQFCLTKSTAGGVQEVLDVHWRLSNRHVFSNQLQWDELSANCEPVAQLGQYARTPVPVYALLIACLHLAGHHHHQERLIWLVDIDLLVRSLSHDQLHEFRTLAHQKRLSSICRSLLVRTGELFKNPVAIQLADQLNNHQPNDEPTALFTNPNMPEWRRLISDIRALPNWKQRLLLVREHLLPSASYMHRRFGTTSHWSLPWCYLKRILLGLGRLWRP